MVAKQFGIRSERYKLIRFYQFDEWEFYDLEKDPKELTNQYNNPEYQSEIARMKKELSSLRAGYGDIGDVSAKPKAWKDQFRKPE